MLHIIHLPEREDRFAKLQLELDRENITEYKIHSGVKDHFPFSGIRIAHQNIVREAKYYNLPSITIAEDDIKFLGKPGAYSHYLQNMPPTDDFDLYLGGIMNGEIGNDNIVLGGYFTGLTLYTISNKFYDTFLSVNKTGNIDALLRGMGKFVVCDPMIVSQHGGVSDNKGALVKSYDDRLIGRNLWK